MGKISLSSGITHDNTPLIVMTIQDNDSMPTNITLPVEDAVGLGLSLISQAAKVTMVENLYQRLSSEMNHEQIDKIVEGLGDVHSG